MCLSGEKQREDITDFDEKGARVVLAQDEGEQKEGCVRGCWGGQKQIDGQR